MRSEKVFINLGLLYVLTFIFSNQPLVVVERKNDKQANKQYVLTEYQQAQSSAQHHENLLWVSAGLFITGVSVIIFFIITQFENLPGTTVMLLSFIGMGLSLAGLLFIDQFRYYRNLAYYRCKEIELNHPYFKLHLRTEFCDSNISKLKSDAINQSLIKKPMPPFISAGMWLVRIIFLFVIITFVLLIFFSWFSSINAQVNTINVIQTSFSIIP